MANSTNLRYRKLHHFSEEHIRDLWVGLDMQLGFHVIVEILRCRMSMSKCCHLFIKLDCVARQSEYIAKVPRSMWHQNYWWEEDLRGDNAFDQWEGLCGK